MNYYLNFENKINRCITLLFVLLFCGFNIDASQNKIILSNKDKLNSKTSEDSCIIAQKIKKTITEFIDGENELIYSKDFISNFSEINKYHGPCYFPKNNDEVNLYFYLGDSVLLKRSEYDERAVKLLIDLYLVNWNNAELSEYYGYRIINKIAIKNLNSFIKVLSERTEKEANKCIENLKYIKNASEIEKINCEISKINNKEYSIIVKKIKEIIH